MGLAAAGGVTLDFSASAFTHLDKNVSLPQRTAEVGLSRSDFESFDPDLLSNPLLIPPEETATIEVTPDGDPPPDPKSIEGFDNYLRAALVWTPYGWTLTGDIIDHDGIIPGVSENFGFGTATAALGEQPSPFGGAERIPFAHGFTDVALKWDFVVVMRFRYLTRTGQGAPWVPVPSGGYPFGGNATGWSSWMVP